MNLSMKKNILFPTLAIALLAVAPSCSKDYVEYTQVHVYGPDENPPLKGSDEFNSTSAMTIKMGETDGRVVSLNDYAENIQNRMGMTIDEVFAGLNHNTISFYVVNPNRRVWDKAPANAGENTWAFSANGIVTDPANAAVFMKFDPVARTLTYNITDNTPSGIISVVCGFVKNDDSSFPVNFRIQNVITVADKSIIDISGLIPTGDYAFYPVNMADYADNIAYAFGITDLTKLANGLGDVEVRDYDLYLVKPSGERQGGYDKYTANAPGYWANSDYEICNWGNDGFTYYVEGDFFEEVSEGNWQPRADGGAINIGRAPGIESGTNMQINFVIVSVKDPSKTLTFLCNMTFE